MKTGEVYVLLVIMAAMAGLTITGTNDPSLAVVHRLGNVPYGILWVLMNPLYWTSLPYKLFALACQVAVLVAMLVLVKKGRMNKVMMYMFLMTNVYSMWFTGFGANSFMLFQPFVVLNPLFELIGVLQVLPIWSLSLSDPHLQCFLGNCVAYTIPRTNLIQDLPALLITPSTYGHLTLLFWMVAPLVAWWMRRRAAKAGRMFNETRFWLVAAAPLFAAILATFVVYNFYGCCAAWSFER